MSNAFVRIETPSAISTGIGTRITTADGAEILGIRKIEISIDPKEPIVAKMEISASAVVDAAAYFYVCDPQSGTLKRVRRIEFLDGSQFEA